MTIKVIRLVFLSFKSYFNYDEIDFIADSVKLNHEKRANMSTTKPRVITSLHVHKLNDVISFMAAKKKLYKLSSKQTKKGSIYTE